MKTYIINLPKDKNRKIFQEEQLKYFNIDYEFINAISTNDISPKTYKQHKYDWQRPLRNVEVACYYSHQCLWKRIIDSNKPALILEDDAFLSQNILHFINNIPDIKNIDYINLEVRSRKKLLSKQSINIPDSYYKMHKLYLDRTGAAGYILYPSGAKKLIAHEEKIGIGLTDAHITSCYQLNGYQVEPAPIIQLDQCKKYNISSPIETSSNIDIKKRPKIKLKDKLYFTTKRISAQLKQALVQIIHFHHAKKREIKIYKKDFIFLKNSKDMLNE
jgi:glycosyl transferase family 25